MLTEPLLSCPCCVFGVIVTTDLQCSYWGKEVVGQNLTIHPSSPQYAVYWPVLFAEKHPQKHDFSTPMLHGWDVVFGIVLILLLPPNTASGVYTKKLYFGLIWPHDLLPCLESVSRSWGVPTMKITDLSILCKWENLKNCQCIKCLFAPLYVL